MCKEELTDQTTVVLCAGYTKSVIPFRGELLKQLKSMGYNVIVMAPEADERTESILKMMDIRFVRYRLSRTSVALWNDLATIWDLTRNFREFGPDLVLSYTIKPVIYGSIAARLSGTHRIVSLITGLGYTFSGLNSFRERFFRLMIQIMYRVALSFNEHVFFQNTDDEQLFRKKRILKKDASTSVVSGSGIPLNEFRYSPPPESELTFILVARLIRAKGIVEFVEAARIIKTTNPDIRFTLLGAIDTNPTALTKDDVIAWHKEGVISYLGETDDVRPYLRASSVFVLPTKYGEGIPRSILEAMAVGRAIVTTDSPGCRDTVQDFVNGILVPPGDSHALALALSYFIDHPSAVVDMGIESRRRAEEMFDVIHVNRQILTTLRLVP